MIRDRGGRAIQQISGRPACIIPVSYTHLDVYKRQISLSFAHPATMTMAAAPHSMAIDLRGGTKLGIMI